jgi:ankyrin repeat protein
VEVVKTLLDKRFFGVNDFLPFLIKERKYRISLTGVCLISGIDNSVLRYLLSRDDFDPNAPWHRDHPHDKAVHFVARAKHADQEVLKMIIDHPNCSAADVAENGTIGSSPLHHLCDCTNDRKYAVAKMKVLLAAGANPELQDVRGRTAYDLLMERLKNAGAEEDVDLTTELFATLQKAVLARRL